MCIHVHAFILTCVCLTMIPILKITKSNNKYSDSASFVVVVHILFLSLSLSFVR